MAKQMVKESEDEVLVIRALLDGKVPALTQPNNEFSAKRFMLRQMAFYVAKTFMVGSRSSFLRKWFALKVARLVAESVG